MYLPTLVSPMSMPSLSSSPCIRGAPHSTFSRLNLRISSRTLFETAGRPGCPRRTFHVQNRRKLLRCHAITVSGLTMTRADRQSFHTAHSHTHRTRSGGVNFGRFTEMQNAELMPQREVLKLECGSGFKGAEAAAANTGSVLSDRRRDRRRTRKLHVLIQFDIYDRHRFGGPSGPRPHRRLRR